MQSQGQTRELDFRAEGRPREKFLQTDSHFARARVSENFSRAQVRDNARLRRSRRAEIRAPRRELSRLEFILVSSWEKDDEKEKRSRERKREKAYVLPTLW